MPDDNQEASLPTYEKAILQTVAYKRIRETVNRILKQFKINTTQWMVLGILYDHPNGHKTSAIAHTLQVEVPLITTLSQSLLASHYIEQTQDLRDRRSKPLKLTEEGNSLYEKIEARLVKEMKLLETNLSPEDLKVYFQTLRVFIANAERAEQQG